MSDVQNTPAPVTEAGEATAPAAAINADTTAPVASETKPEATTETSAPPTTTEEATPAAAAPTAEETKEEKTVEPIIEGQLAYKGPGLVKSLIPSKKEFWLNDDAVSPSNLGLYLRGEKPEIANSVVAWASQTGKGLLFFNKKGETERSHPADVLALYDATDLKKQSPHEFSLKINGHNHTFKAANDAERDGWYQSIEKAVELGKASKEEVHNSEGYKAELEKLSKPSTVAGAALRSQSKPKKSTDAADKTVERTGSVEDEDVEKKQKSRSTSRGMLNRLKGKKEEVAEKKEEKKEEKEAEKEEKKAEETGPVSDSTEAAPVLAGAAALETPAAAEAAAAEPAVETPAVEEKAEKSKPAKRGSIFGRVSSGWSGLKSPAKEKEAKDAELKAEPKDAAVSENPPVLPETATAEPALETPAVPAVEEPTEAKPEAPKDETATPTKEKSNFLSGLGFMKRNRSVSPSTPMKQEPAKKETDETPAEAVKTEEPAIEGAAVETEADKPVEKAEEPAKAETPNKRQSVLGSLGRRASKALNRMQAPKKSEPTAAASTEAKKEETTEGAKAAEETPVVNGETKQTEEEAQKSIGDVVPDAVNVGQPQAQQSAPTVTASA
ncbi:Hypothetical predicted protein [Lecanosticta acicola]|uniref:PH domain-containing protein n=1 Tax=Lecanosticta acicola TaxID=111012 RepID=A0AAI8YWK1_9PEZI|nr:Hypothetical predicted protein [Lecanosticta acicola]